MLSAVAVITIASACAALIAAWVWWKHGRGPALVMLAFAAAALACLWINFEVFPVDEWRYGSLLRTCLVFAVPAAAGTVLVLVQRRGRMDARAWGYLAALWLTPAVLIWFSQLAPFQTGSDTSFANRIWWGGSSILIYICVPLVYAALAGQNPRSYGLSLTLIRTEARSLLLIIPAVALLVFWISADARFQQVYPFYDYRGGGEGAALKLAIFEIVYGLSFVALEFFFRGFLVMVGAKFIGVHAVPVMAFTYCILHLGKPMPEMASSLIGGLLLGYIALRYRSIAIGVAAHLTMAWGMDAAVLARTSG